MRTFQGRIARVRRLSFSPDGSTLVSAGGGGLIRVWDTQAGQVRCRFRSTYDRVYGLAISPDGSGIASTAVLDDGIRLWSAAGSEVAMLPESGCAVSIEYRPDGRALLASGFGRIRQGFRGFSHLWDLDARKVAARFRTRICVSASTFSPDGSLVAMSWDEAGILFWDPARSPDGSPIFDDEEHPAAPSDPVKRRSIRQKHEPHCMRFSPDGRLLAVSSGWSINLYDVREGLKVAAFRGHRQMVKSLDFSPDGRTLASASHDGTVRFWDVDSGKERACFDWNIGAVDCAVFAPDGMTIAVGGVGGIVVWDVE